MSMALLVVLARHEAPTGEAWQKAFKEHHAPVEFSNSPDLVGHNGFIPLTVRGRQSGFYYLSESYVELRTHYPALADVKLQEPVVYSLGYGGHFLEYASAFYAASVLVAQFGGSAFDPQGATFMTAEQLVEAAKHCEKLAEGE